MSPSGYATVGGFPFQMQVISELFSESILMLPRRATPPPEGIKPLVGHNLRVLSLEEPVGLNLKRKIALLSWLPRNLIYIWRTVRTTDAVHAPVPGDIGTIGILVALAQRKPLFVRHCGTWGEPVTIADRFLLWLLERIAGGRNVVMATGGSDDPPSLKNPAISWISSTTLSEAELVAMPDPQPWRKGQPLRLVTVGRLSTGKNSEAVIWALPVIRQHYPQTSLDVVGDGPCLGPLKALAQTLGIAEAVTFHGNVAHEQVLKILSDAHLFVFPTRVKEGFPKAVVEAMACGLPVIATAVSVLPHLIGSQNGLLLAATDYEAVAEAVKVMIADDRRLAEMSISARETSRDYTLERWQDTIRRRLTASWGSLRREDAEDSPDPVVMVREI